MQLKCSKCQRLISIADDKLPRDREKAMIKCPGCQQVLVFTVPASLRTVAPAADKTIITSPPAETGTERPRLCSADGTAEYPLKPGKNIIGRDADVCIPGDKYISRKHCLVEVIEKNRRLLCILTDDGSINENNEPSTNGTFYNDSRLSRFDKIYLNDGDRIRIGHSDFIFKMD